MYIDKFYFIRRLKNTIPKKCVYPFPANFLIFIKTTALFPCSFPLDPKKFKFPVQRFPIISPVTGLSI